MKLPLRFEQNQLWHRGVSERDRPSYSQGTRQRKENAMPILNVKVSARRTPELSARINETLLDLTSRVLGKRRDLTAVVIDYVDPRDWFVAGKSLEELKQASFYFDVKVVDETNTKAEKARYVAEAFEAFAAILGDLHNESYVYVQDVRAAAYGFGGRTQEYRHQHPDQ
jgi:4-oxalocrotonate tautomerase